MNIREPEAHLNRLRSEETPPPVNPVLVKFTMAQRLAGLIEDANRPWLAREREKKEGA